MVSMHGLERAKTLDFSLFNEILCLIITCFLYIFLSLHFNPPEPPILVMITLFKQLQHLPFG